MVDTMFRSGDPPHIGQSPSAAPGDADGATAAMVTKSAETAMSRDMSISYLFA